MNKIINFPTWAGLALLSHAPLIAAQWARAAVHTISGRLLTLFAPPCPSDGQTGREEPADRLLFINGIGSSPPKCQHTAEQISAVFDGAQVHYAFCPLSFFQVVAALATGWRSPSTARLLCVVRRHLSELSFQPNRQLVILAHSGGGTLLSSIRRCLTTDERRRITVITFGSASLIKPSLGFSSTLNFVANGDRVPRIAYLFRKVCAFFHPLPPTKPLAMSIVAHDHLPSSLSALIRCAAAQLTATRTIIGSCLACLARRVARVGRALFGSLPNTIHLPPQGDGCLISHSMTSKAYLYALRLLKTTFIPPIAG